MNQEFIIERVNKQNFNDLLYLIETQNETDTYANKTNDYDATQ